MAIKIINSIKDAHYDEATHTCKEGKNTTISRAVDKRIYTYEEGMDFLINARFPADFDGWDLTGGNEWTIAHRAAARGLLPKGFTGWDISDNHGFTIAHMVAVSGGKLPDTFDQWDLITQEGFTVTDIVKRMNELYSRFGIQPVLYVGL